MRQNGISDMLQVNNVNNGNSSSLINLTNGNNSQSGPAPPVPPRSVNNNGDNLRCVIFIKFRFSFRIHLEIYYNVRY